MEDQVKNMGQTAGQGKGNVKEQPYRISGIVSEFPEEYRECIQERLEEVETALDNFILSLVF